MLSLQRVKPYLLAAVSGVLYALAYEHGALWPLAFVALVPLLVAVERAAASSRPTVQALRLGVCAGLLQQGIAYRWLLPTIADFSGMPFAATALAWTLLIAYQAGQLALWCALLVRGRTRGWPLLALAPLAWGAIEQLYPLLFPSPFAAVLHAQPLLLQSLELWGARPISMLLVLTSAALVMKSGGTGKRESGKPASESKFRFPLSRFPVRLSVLAAWIALAAYGAWRIAAVETAVAAAPKLELGLVQANLGTAQKRRDGAASRRIQLELTRGLLQTGRPELLIWPETALPGLIAADVRELSGVVGELGTPLLSGAVVHRNALGRARLWNSAFLLDDHARVIGRSDKLRLVPFAERLPFGERVPQLYELAPGAGAFSPGRAPAALQLNGHAIAVLICYEDILPDLVREVVAATRPQLLVNITNDAWFGDTAAPHIHFALSTLRAIEHRRFLVRATNSGVSAVVDPTGRVLATLPLFQRATLRTRVALLAAVTPYARLGDLAGYLALLACALLCFARRRRDP